ncbi:hypothetical protein IP81_15825 [Novosphingobium sp. AAP83]|uniref:hypothetical protein n=1 Tax=Novosphingobium sp. AAP83 TaxID=1523425 RepID=UPI0006B9A724|nr:hypothetical protein [Novosphingobium sp. AAP83]KPF90210.1 hypothetical protein IP81_15825 [Novosphingobium sp. AAP83]
MVQKSEARAKARATRNSCGGSFRDSTTALTIQAQFLIAAHHVRPELAVMVAALAFGGGTHE